MAQQIGAALRDAQERGQQLRWWVWMLAGLAGTIAMVGSTGSISALPQPATIWWWRGACLSYGLAHAIFYAGVALLVCSWWMLEPRSNEGTGRLLTCASVWSLPLFLGAPLFSRDLYSYVAVGQLLHDGLNPYVVSPLGGLRGNVLYSIANVWRSSITPYGPFYLLVERGASALTGSSETIAILGARLTELGGAALLVCGLRYVPLSPSARSRALWLALASPSALVCYVSAGHNDTIMIGLMVVGVAMLQRGYVLIAGLALGLAVATKTPAALAVAYGAWALRPHATDGVATRELRRWLPSLSLAIYAGLGVVAADIGSGCGWGWLTPTALRIPTKVHTEITPINNVAHLFDVPFRIVGVGPSFHTFLQWCTVGAEAATAVIVVRLAVGLTMSNIRIRTGLALFALALLGPTTWPWYFLWGAVLLATTPAASRNSLGWLVATSTLLVGPGGTMMIGGNGWIVTAPLLLAGLWWFTSTGRWRTCLALDDASEAANVG